MNACQLKTTYWSYRNGRTNIPYIDELYPSLLSSLITFKHFFHFKIGMTDEITPVGVQVRSVYI